MGEVNNAGLGTQGPIFVSPTIVLIEFSCENFILCCLYFISVRLLSRTESIKLRWNSHCARLPPAFITAIFAVHVFFY